MAELATRAIDRHTVALRQAERAQNMASTESKRAAVEAQVTYEVQKNVISIIERGIPAYKGIENAMRSLTIEFKAGVHTPKEYAAAMQVLNNEYAKAVNVYSSYATPLEQATAKHREAKQAVKELETQYTSLGVIVHGGGEAAAENATRFDALAVALRNAERAEREARQEMERLSPAGQKLAETTARIDAGTWKLRALKSSASLLPSWRPCLRTMSTRPLRTTPMVRLQQCSRSGPGTPLTT